MQNYSNNNYRLLDRKPKNLVQPLKKIDLKRKEGKKGLIALKRLSHNRIFSYHSKKSDF
jgi:hypothetical protein